MKKVIFLVVLAMVISIGCKRPNTDKESSWKVTPTVNTKEVWEVTDASAPTDIHILGDFDGDGKKDNAIYRPTIIVTIVKHDHDGNWVEQKFPCLDKNYSFCQKIKPGWVIIAKSGGGFKFFSPIE